MEHTSDGSFQQKLVGSNSFIIVAEIAAEPFRRSLHVSGVLEYDHLALKVGVVLTPLKHVGRVVRQEASMDDRVWRIYFTELLKHELVAETPSVILVDNLASHVSNASV
ncbi:hypothetical protein H257_19326 [Aphanomyces astaci]|uniref:DDE-1 domain-containing protein n=1 Tax=Aphanomyces astaci TaxID=112090 RepID=W4FAK8_APHAT|nr:hypothetical protein H257_19326 [Aphanomyces astaci]ETV63743.1 hypothetical protein H257_19326 [Aphanomyces astaci]|eukprot:XP_009846773.1 hypothetical protein H257_19326 [Aphanomyces astaci]